MLLYINKKYFSFKINYCFDLKMQPFWFFAAAKELGVCTLLARFAGGKATTNKKLKNIFSNLKFFSITIVNIYCQSLWIIEMLSTFLSHSLCGLRQSCKKCKYYSFICFGICIKYKIIPIFLAKKMQFFWFFYTNTEGTSYGRKRSGES